MNTHTSVAVVGGGLAATRTIEELRRHGHRGSITLLCGEPHAPYDRPPLSKQVLRGERDTMFLRPDWADLDIDLRLGRRAAAVRPDERTLVLDDGGTLTYDSLVIATGAEPRSLPALAGEGVHLLRTIDDARALSTDVRRTGRLTIVGAGFIGCEVAASARALEAEVTLIEILPAPLSRVLGLQVSAEISRLHTEAGVQLHCGVSMAESRGSGDTRELLLSNGSVVDSGVTLVALGVTPATGWLQDSGLAIEDGIVCDDTGRTSIPGIWAAGDVARWWHPHYQTHVRLEHWTSAAGQGVAVAADISGTLSPYTEIPYFWSDQYKTKLQMLGRPHPDDEVTVLRVGPDADRLLAIYSRAGHLTAVFGAGAGKWVMRMHRLLEARASYPEALAAATT